MMNEEWKMKWWLSGCCGSATGQRDSLFLMIFAPFAGFLAILAF